MKVAYIMNGHSRTWRACYESFFDNLFSVVPGDIFIHTWDRVNAKTSAYWNNFNLQGLEEVSNRIADINGIIKAYNPKYIIVETDLGVEHISKEINSKCHHNLKDGHLGLKNLYYGQHKIFNVAKTLDHYDRYVFIRPDLKFINKFNESLLYNDNVVIPYLSDFAFEIWKITNTHQGTVCTDFYYQLDECLCVDMDKQNRYVEHCIYDYWRKNDITPYAPLPHMSLNYEIVRITEDTY